MSSSTTSGPNAGPPPATPARRGGADLVALQPQHLLAATWAGGPRADPEPGSAQAFTTAASTTDYFPAFQDEANGHTSRAETAAPSFGPNSSTARAASEGKARA